MATAYIYVLHFHQPLAHAQHYVGCTENLTARLEAHANGAGARLMKELLKQGLSWELGGLYSTSHAEMRRNERYLKDVKNAARYCQLCHPNDQHRLGKLQTENIENIPYYKRSSENITKKHVSICTVRELELHEESEGMKFIHHLMRRDKDALGFVPIGGEKGIHQLLEKRQIILAYENGEPCGYTFYTLNPSKTQLNIHQACVADDARLKGHGEALVAHVTAKHIDARIVAKVREDLAANHFWKSIGFSIEHTKTHATSGSTIHHYAKEALIPNLEEPQL